MTIEFNIGMGMLMQVLVSNGFICRSDILALSNIGKNI